MSRLSTILTYGLYRVKANRVRAREQQAYDRIHCKHAAPYERNMVNAITACERYPITPGEPVGTWMVPDTQTEEYRTPCSKTAWIHLATMDGLGALTNTFEYREQLRGWNPAWGDMYEEVNKGYRELKASRCRTEEEKQLILNTPLEEFDFLKGAKIRYDTFDEMVRKRERKVKVEGVIINILTGTMLIIGIFLFYYAAKPPKFK